MDRDGQNWPFPQWDPVSSLASQNPSSPLLEDSNQAYIPVMEYSYQPVFLSSQSQCPVFCCFLVCGSLLTQVRVACDKGEGQEVRGQEVGVERVV